MKNLLKKRLSNEKGLTLVELLAVIVILGIIAAIAVPSIGGIIENSKVGAFKSDILNAISASELYVIDNPDVTSVTLELLQGGATKENAKYIEDKGSLDSFAYNVSDKTVTSVAKDKKITVTATNATKKNLIDFPNNTRTTVNNVGASKTAN